MKDARLAGLALGLSLALSAAGCATAPGLSVTNAPDLPLSEGTYLIQQRNVPPTVQARQRIREELERGYPDYSPSVQALNVSPIIPGQRYRFRARVTVIGIAGPSVPLRYLVEGTYDLRTHQVVETSRTPLSRPARR